MDYYLSLSHDDLFKMCEEKGVSTKGSSKEIATRLMLLGTMQHEGGGKTAHEIEEEENKKEREEFEKSDTLLKGATKTKTMVKPEKRRAETQAPFKPPMKKNKWELEDEDEEDDFISLPLDGQPKHNDQSNLHISLHIDQKKESPQQNFTSFHISLKPDDQDEVTRKAKRQAELKVVLYRDELEAKAKTPEEKAGIESKCAEYRKIVLAEALNNLEKDDSELTVIRTAQDKSSQSGAVSSVSGSATAPVSTEKKSGKQKEERERNHTSTHESRYDSSHRHHHSRH